jgi:hypothetical protein
VKFARSSWVHFFHDFSAMRVQIANLIASTCTPMHDAYTHISMCTNSSSFAQKNLAGEKISRMGSVERVDG